MWIYLLIGVCVAGLIGVAVLTSKGRDKNLYWFYVIPVILFWPVFVAMGVISVIDQLMMGKRRQ